MADLMRFDGKVVLVTGSGAGLGREYALEFAKRGASVVVNDLGTTPDGRGQPSRAADKVVAEIRKAGGKAVANYDSVEFGEKLVQTALENYGRIDIVINNAGILRDRSFARISEDDWDIVHKVHLKGAFSVTRAAWPHMRKNKYGRIVMTSSPSGLYGNFGQTNYSAAKLGLVGFANSLALEGVKYGIMVNTIAPTAHTRMTEDIMPQEALEDLKAAYIMPLVVYLCHDSYNETSGVFELSGGHICKLRWQRTKGAALREPGKEMLAEDVRDNWSAVTDWKEPNNVKDILEANMYAAAQIGRIQSGDNDLCSGHPIQPQLAKQHKFADITTEHDQYKCILYALGVGMSTKDPDHLKFLFEGSEDFCVLPSYGVIPAFQALGGLTQAEGIDIDPTKILHGEQYLELHKPIPTSARLINRPKIIDVLDKGSGCAIVMNVDSFDEESGDLIFTNQFVTFVVGYGGFRGQRSSAELKPHLPVPKRAADASVEETTNADQAALYRLSGDYNPLHIDPMFAAMGGFKQPILHGLSTFGHATRHVMKQFAGNDPARVKAIKVRFSNPVLPGNRLRTEMWKSREVKNRVHFQTINLETKKVCLAGAYMDLHEAAAGDEEEVEVETSNRLASDNLFEGISSHINARMVAKVRATYRWNITSGSKNEVAKSWFLDLKNGDGHITSEDADTKANCTITMSDENVVNMFNGKLNAQQAFFSGKMKVGGNMMLAQKLEVLFKAVSPKL